MVAAPAIGKCAVKARGTEIVSLLIAVAVVGCSSIGSVTSQPTFRDSPLCAHIPPLHTARTEFLAALASGRSGRLREAVAGTNRARDLARSVGEALADQAVSRAGTDQPLALALTSVVLAIDQGSFLINDGTSQQPSASDIERVVSQVAPAIDDAVLNLDELAIHGDATTPAYCPGAAFSFEPREFVLGGPAVSPDLRSLGLPARIMGMPVSLSTEAVSPNSPSADAITGVGGSILTAYFVSIESGDIAFAVLRTPGFDASALIESIPTWRWPDAIRPTEVMIGGRPATRFDTRDGPGISLTTSFAIARADSLFLFEDVDEETVSAVMSQVR